MNKIAQIRARKLKEQEAREKEALESQPKPKPTIAEINSHMAGGKIQEAVKAKKERIEAKSLSPVQRFEKDLESLSGLSLAAKTAIKRKLIEEYREYCESFAQTAEVSKQDRIFQYWVVWLFDVGIEDKDILDQFLKYANEAIRLEQKPSFIKRPFLEFKRWSILEWSEEVYNDGKSPDPWFSAVFDEVADWDKMGVQLARRALTLKFKLLQDAGKLKEAAEIGKIAINHKAKVKTRYQEVLAALEA